MAGEYNIKWSHDQNGGNPLKPRFTINTNTVNGPGNTSVDTPLLLPGRFSSNYGQNLAQSFIWMLENFSSPNEPSPTTSGMLWFDSANEVVNVRNTNNNGWVELGAGGSSLVISPTEPVEFEVGTLWFDTSVEIVKIRNTTNTDWISINASGGGVPATTTESIDSILLTNSHASKYIRLLNENPTTVTVPADATDDMPIDTEIHLRTVTEGVTSIVGEDGVTVNCPTGFGPSMDVAGSTVTLKKVAADEWDLFGLLVMLTIYPPAVFTWVSTQGFDAADDQGVAFDFIDENTMVYCKWHNAATDEVHVQAYDISNPSAYAAVGNPFIIAAGANDWPMSICALTSNRVALVHGRFAYVALLEFDGTDWTLVGNNHALNLGTYTSGSGTEYRVSKLADDKIVLFFQEDSGAGSSTSERGLITYQFDGTDWNQIDLVNLPLATYSNEIISATRMDEDGTLALVNSAILSYWTWDGSTWNMEGNTFDLGELQNGDFPIEFWYNICNTKKGDNTIYLMNYDWPDADAIVHLRELKFDGTDWTYTTSILREDTFELVQYMTAGKPVDSLEYTQPAAPSAGRLIVGTVEDSTYNLFFSDLTTA